MIKNLYHDAKCKILMNDVDIECFRITSGCPHGRSLSGTLFNISMLPLLVKLNLLPKHTDTMPFITYAQRQLNAHGILDVNPSTFGYADDLMSIIRVDLVKDRPINQISNILNVYEDFSKISGLKNNASKTIYDFIADHNNPHVKNIVNYLSKEYGADRQNFKFNGDDIPFLGDILTLGKDENRPDTDFKLAINTSLSKRLDKIKKIINSWYSKDFYFPTVFARSLASKTYLSSQTLHLFQNTTLDQIELEETQRVIDRYVNKKILMPRNNTYLRFHDGAQVPLIYTYYIFHQKLHGLQS